MENNEERLIKFVNKLIHKTKNRNIYWESLFDFTEREDLSSLPCFEYIFFEYSNHKVDYLNTFIAFTENFIIAVGTETIDNYSGFGVEINGSTEITEYNIYIAKDKYSTAEQLFVADDHVLSLIETIHATYSNGSTIDNIIDTFNKE